MKTQIVNLDPYDDYDSVRDKILWTKSPRVILVWPGRGDLLSSRLDLVLLQRLGQQRGLTLGLLTFDPQVRAHASDLGIPVFDKLEPISESEWDIWQPEVREPIEVQPDREIARPPRARQVFTSPKHPLGRAVLLLLPILFLFICFLLLVPTAQVTVQPGVLREFVILNFTSDPPGDNGRLHVPSRALTFDVASDLRIPTTGSSNTPDQAARGNVIFTNLTNEIILIPAGTSVRSQANPDLIFRTDREAQVKGGDGEQVIVEVAALNPGPDSNLNALAIDGIDGPLGLSLSVTNPDEFTGGSFEIRSAVSGTDRRNVRRLLEDELKALFLQQVQERMALNEIALIESVDLVEVLSETYDAEIGAIADTINLELSVLFSISIVDRIDLEKQASEVLLDDLPTGYIFADGSPQLISLVELIDTASEQVNFEVEFSVQTYRKVDLGRVKQLALGQSTEMFNQRLLNQYERDLQPEITLKPSWWPILPIFAHQINVSQNLEGIQ